VLHCPLKFAAVAAVLISLSAASQNELARPAATGPRTLVVPTDYPTIQAAIDAAKPGRTVQVLAGTYSEQIAISKDLNIVGAGMDATIIRAPGTLVPNTLGSPSIVEVYNGANVSMSQLTVRGPGAAACGESGVLRWGIRVHSQAHLDFGFAAVRDIQNTPMAPCPQSGTAFSVGTSVPGGPPASLTIHHSEVTNYQSVGIIVLGAGSWADITRNLIAGPGHAGVVPTNGIELVAGAVGTIAHNTISGNVCPAGTDICGPDFFTQFQQAGIGAGGNGPGTVISHNRLVGNQIGMFLSEVDEISQNVMVDNDYFGLALVGVADGSFAIDGGEISGGGGGVWVTAVLADMTVVLNKVTFSDLSGPPVEILEDGGYTATVVGGP
jgi:hypothetical protein